jgi:hypothetical protein
MKVEQRLRVFQSRVLKKILGRRKEKIAGGWRKLHDEENHDLYSSPNNIRRIKFKRKKEAGNVACKGFWLESLKEKDQLEDLGVPWD